jgi:glutamyl-Q tRNA(Asp) synthetase
MIVTRFAPSPTGYLHLGHLHSALFGFLAAEISGGQFLLRIEDIDTARCRAEFEQALLDDLAWVGLSWSGAVRRQSANLRAYIAGLEQLRDMGLIYPCFCSRRDISAAATAPHGMEGLIYPGTCRDLPVSLSAERQSRGDPYALRLDSRKAAKLAGTLSFRDSLHGLITVDPDILGDVVLARRDAPASYHLCVTLDDDSQGVTLITRGVDLLAATHVHRLLQAVLGLAVPDYHHHLLLTNNAGQRLAKRDKSLSLRQMRDDGLSAATIRAMAGEEQIRRILQEKNITGS